MAEAPPRTDLRPRQGLVRLLWLALGLFWLSLAVLGILLPGLPTTPFVLLAAGCFARSSRRLHGWLHRHPRLGPLVQAWEARGAIPRRAKWIATTMIAIALGVLLLGSTVAWGLKAVVVGFVVWGLLFIWRRPD